MIPLDRGGACPGLALRMDADRLERLPEPLMVPRGHETTQHRP